MPEAFRTMTMSAGQGEPLFRAVLKEGMSLKEGANGLFSSSAIKADGMPGWANFEQVNPSITMPYDLTTLAMAIALAQITRKLDCLQETADEMFDYLKIKDKASVRASLETLSAIMGDYRFNWNNAQFKEAKYSLVQTINRDARQYMIELKARIASKLEKKGLVELRLQTESAAEEILDMLKEYQLAMYLYSYSTFLGVMLLENYDHGYLEGKAASIKDNALEYRRVYTDCFDAIESRNLNSADAKVFGMLSAGAKGLGKVAKKTPLSKRAPIDKALSMAGLKIEQFDSDVNERMYGRLTEAKDPAVMPLAECIQAVDCVYNQPCELLVDSEALYFRPL